ncbi:MAG: c-type cytochrome [Bacteroidia bacterium]
MKNVILVVSSFGMLVLGSCGNSEADLSASTQSNEKTEEATPVPTDPMQNKGVGPISSLTLEAIDPALAESGKTLFEGKCSACHKMDKRSVGPALDGITERRTPEWIMNMILDPERMTKEDPIASELLAEYMAPMANQSLTEDEARKILEYFRSNDNK